MQIKRFKFTAYKSIEIALKYTKMTKSKRRQNRVKNLKCHYSSHSSSDLVVWYITLYYGISSQQVPEPQYGYKLLNWIANIDHLEFYSLLLDCLLYLHFIFLTFLVKSCLLLLKLHFLPFTLVLQIPNLSRFLTQVGLFNMPPYLMQVNYYIPPLMAIDTAFKSTKMLTETIQIWYTLLHDKPEVVVLSTSAKHLKVWKVASAVIRSKSEIILDANTRLSYMITSLNIIIPYKMLL